MNEQNKKLSGTHPSKMTQQNQIFAVFDELIAGHNSFDWSAVVKAVKATKIPVTNWLKVRGVLQWFINEGTLVRTPSVHVEEYVVQRGN